jgi:hypothetical protein
MEVAILLDVPIDMVTQLIHLIIYFMLPDSALVFFHNSSLKMCLIFIPVTDYMSMIIVYALVGAPCNTSTTDSHGALATPVATLLEVHDVAGPLESFPDARSTASLMCTRLVVPVGVRVTPELVADARPANATTHASGCHVNTYDSALKIIDVDDPDPLTKSPTGLVCTPLYTIAITDVALVHVGKVSLLLVANLHDVRDELVLAPPATTLVHPDCDEGAVVLLLRYANTRIRSPISCEGSVNVSTPDATPLNIMLTSTP